MLITRVTATGCKAKDGHDIAHDTEHSEECAQHLYRVAVFERDPRRRHDDEFVAAEDVVVPADAPFALVQDAVKATADRLRAAPPDLQNSGPSIVAQALNRELALGE
jgi:hypothetical protein